MMTHDVWKSADIMGENGKIVSFFVMEPLGNSSVMLGKSVVLV
ncbi:hypothetical protein BLGI_3346 [Brevibacillus laterosporus GI-9]|nr:hypothetical protein BLGI_3346 [Brevibacillus laterosporus GI-9]